MEPTYNMHEAKTHLSRLVEMVEAGEEVVLARAGRPVARIVPYRARVTARTPGLLAGQIWMGPGFDEADPEIQELFEG